MIKALCTATNQGKGQAKMWTIRLPRILGLRSMSLTGRRTRGLESSDGIAVPQHCTLGKEEQLFNHHEQFL